MHCPFCHYTDSRVVDSRSLDDGQGIRRRRECLQCKRRFTTTETAALVVLKRSGVTEPFSREKIIEGLGKACQGRPVSRDDLAVLAGKVEERVRQAGQSQVNSGDIGQYILDPLKELDQVAYLRFASVYSSFDSLEDFEEAIASLRADNEAASRAATDPA